MPDYGFKADSARPPAGSPKITTSLAGLYGGLFVLFLTILIGLGLKKLGAARATRQPQPQPHRHP
jgi:hypothetical protein